ncbi:MAG: outer membrane beta-barrel protein [Bacteroidetes bacterium]|nr:outer membrane beta-barrel protein [Bacteroidota bacterium]
MKTLIHKILLLLFFTVTLNTFGQYYDRELNEVLSEKKWKIGAFIMPTILTNHRTSNKINYTFLAGLMGEKKLSNALSLTSGISYIRTKFNHGSWNGAPCGGNGGCYIYTTTDYIEIPLMLKMYYLKEKRNINPYISFGVVTGFSFKNETERIDLHVMLRNYYRTTHYIHDDKFKYQQSLLCLNFGTEIKLAERLELAIDPTFRYSIFAINRRRLIDFTNYTVFAGLGFGLNYKL